MTETNKTRLIFILAILAFALATSACSEQMSSNNSNTVIDKGDIFPSLVLQDLSGGSSESGVLFANKVIVLNVWATWCPPCRAEMPDLVKLDAILDTKNFAVIGLSTDRNIDQVQQFVNEKKLHFPMFWDQSGRQMAELGVHNYPTTYIIDSHGKVIDKIIGAYPWADARMIARLKGLL
ncbi:MAG: TlpA disulfide reductase family protein [Mariprofundales bacterium]